MENIILQFHPTYFYFVSELREKYWNSCCNKIKWEERKILFRIKGLLFPTNPFAISYTVPVNDEFFHIGTM
jgi:hypothetical protein